MMPAALIAVGLFLALAAAVAARHGIPFGVDVAVHLWALDHRDAVATDVAIAVTTTGSGPPAYALAAVTGALAAGRCRRLVGAAAAMTALAAGQLIRFTLAASFQRARPPVVDWAWPADGHAFPSGHATTSALVAALICSALLRAHRARWRWVAVAAALFWAVAVGLTRVYLGVHWPSDVVAGWLLAAALTLGVHALRPWERVRRAPPHT